MSLLSSPVRYPLADLAAMIDVGSFDDLAVMLSMSRRTLLRLHAAGLTHRQADEMAVRAGLVPELVWPGWINDAQPESRRERQHRTGRAA